MQVLEQVQYWESPVQKQLKKKYFELNPGEVDDKCLESTKKKMIRVLKHSNHFKSPSTKTSTLTETVWTARVNPNFSTQATQMINVHNYWNNIYLEYWNFKQDIQG